MDDRVGDSGAVQRDGIGGEQRYQGNPQVGEVCRYIKLDNGLSADEYSLEIIIPVAFRLNTCHAHLFRRWLMEKALAKDKQTAYMVFVQHGKGGYC